MPPLWTNAAEMDLAAWPLPPVVVTHPRTAGTFGRALRLWRNEGSPLMESIRRATLLPAEVLQAAVPAMRRKGRVQAGSDADLVVFDEARVTDQATYPGLHTPVFGHRPPPRGRDLRGPRRRARPRCAAGQAGARRTTVTQLRPAIWPRDCRAREYCDLTLRALRMEDYATTPWV